MQTSSHPTERVIYQLTLLGKAVLGVLQIGAALAIMLGGVQQVPALARWLVQAELAEDKNDYWASHIMAFAQALPGSDLTFYGVYFLLHGALHIGIVMALLKGAEWAHVAAVAILIAFVLYQMVDWWFKGGTMLLVLSAIDVFVIVITLRQMRRPDLQ